MRNWLTNNAIWLGALGAIAAIIATVMMFLPENGENLSIQNTTIDGSFNTTTQAQENPGGSQTATVSGEGNSATQKQ